MRLDFVKLDRSAVEAAIRKSLISATELSRRTGLSYPTILGVRCGKAVRLTTARRVARVLRVPVRTLVAADPVAAGNGVTAA